MTLQKRNQVRKSGLAIVQFFDAADVLSGASYSTSNPWRLPMGYGARYSWQLDANGLPQLAPVENSVGIMANWIVWPGNSPRDVAQIAQVFAVQITSTSPLQAQPIFDTTLALDTTLAELDVTASDGSSPSIGDVGMVSAGTKLTSQELLYTPKGSGGGGGSPFGDWYGDGSSGDVTFSAADHSGTVPKANSFQIGAGFGSGGRTYPTNAWVHGMEDILYCHNLTVDAGVYLFLGKFCMILCTGTLTNNGTISVAGGFNGLAGTSAAPSGGVGHFNNNGADGTISDPPYDESGGTGGTGPGLAGGSGSGGNTPGHVGGRGQSGGVTSGLNKATAGGPPVTGPGFRMFPLGSGMTDYLQNQFRGGSSGGGGASDSAFQQGGLGGPGGGIMMVRAKTVAGTGLFEVDGGNGQGFSGSSLVLGGGGGGNPGAGSLLSDNPIPGTITFSHLPGTGGVGATGGSNGGNGNGAGLFLIHSPTGTTSV